MFIIINKDYTVEKAKVLSGHVRGRARRGEISLIEVRHEDFKTRKLIARGMNLPERQEEFGGEWSDINDYTRPE